MKIFISYGHDHRELGRRVYLDLEALGHQVWFDERTDEGGLKPAQRWEDSIERGIETADWIIALMSPHSMRRPDGVCLDELSYGRFLNRPIVPLMVQMVRPPLCIARLQYIDLQGWQDPATGGLNEAWYQKQFALLDRVLQGKQELGFEGQQSTLRALLQPLDNDSDIARHVKNFVGREWLHAEYQRWRGDAGSRVFWITGGPGVGKSAFAAHLCHKDPGIVGVHFCQFDKGDWRDPARTLQSLAYQLSTQLPDYRQQLLELGSREYLAGKDIGSQFAHLFDPLAKIPTPSNRQILIIDALDEAIDAKGKNPLADTIALNLDKLPEWLGLVITSRPEPDLLRRLSAFQPTVLDTSHTRNLDDIAAYLKTGLAAHVPAARLDHTVRILQEKSEGTFLYASEVLRAIAAKEFDPADPESFPNGLTGIYTRFFERRFPDTDHYEKRVLPLIEIMLAAREPLPEKTAQAVLGWKRRDWDDAILSLGSLFPLREGRLQLFHKSLRDWLTDRERAGDYRAYAEDGNDTLSEALWQQYRQEVMLDDYGLRHLPAHLRVADRMDKYETTLADPEFAAARYCTESENHILEDYSHLTSFSLSHARTCYLLMVKGETSRKNYSWYSDFSFSLSTIVRDVFEAEKLASDAYFYAFVTAMWRFDNAYFTNDRIPDKWMFRYLLEVKNILLKVDRLQLNTAERDLCNRLEASMDLGFDCYR
jgi:hypothetical protein